MQYPLISEYVRAIQDASSNLDKLAHLVPVQDDHGEPYRSSGAFAVVFKMKDEQTGKCYALKCFTEEQEGRAEAYRQIADELEFANSAYITSVKYLDKEIFVDSSCEEDEFPVLLMDWIDGETMEDYIAENYQDNYAMAMLCYRFCKMVAWLRSQPFAHGDIKPDNIMVRPDGSLTLIDYDGMFVPAMKGQKSPTIGTKDFSHPLRTVDDFDENIDDFALASIALSLKAISLKPSLLDEYGGADRLLFSAEDYNELCKINLWKKLSRLKNAELKKLQTCLRLAKNRKKYDNLLISCVKEPTKDATLEEVGFLKAREIFAVCSNRQKQEYLTSNAQYNLIDLASKKEDNSYPIKDILALLAVLSFFALYFIDEELFLNVFLFFMASSSVVFLIIGFVIYAGIIVLGGYLLFVIIKRILKNKNVTMLHIDSKRKKRENILKKYPGAIIADVTSHAEDDLIKLSPFYPHGGIPVPFSEGVTATCVEAVWQGLKVFESADVDIEMFKNESMKNIKRTVRKFGKPLGHRKGVNGTELLGYIEARKQIYIPTYKWVLEHKVQSIIERLREASQTKTIVLLDYNTNCDVDDPKKPLSHAFLIKAYVEGLYPFGDKMCKPQTIEPKQLTLF